MSRATIPMRMTVGTAPSQAPDPGTDVAIIGPELTREMVRYLQNALDGWTMEERLEQLAVIDPRVYGAYRLHRAGHTTEAIARALGISVRTAQRLVATALTFLAPPEWRTHPDLEVRLAWLQIHYPAVADVYEMRSYGYSAERIGELHGLSVDQIKRLSCRGREVVGPTHWRAVRFRRHMDALHGDTREEVSTEVIAERVRSRQTPVAEDVVVEISVVGQFELRDWGSDSPARS